MVDRLHCKAKRTMSAFRGGGDAGVTVKKEPVEETAKLELSDEETLLKTFDPVAHQLEPTFRITHFTELRG